MLQTTRTLRGGAPVSVIGAGIARAWQALLFAKAGHAVTLHERGDDAMAHATSHWAGGMLRAVVRSGGVRTSRLTLSAFARSRYGANVLPDTSFNGSLVVAHPRDRCDLSASRG